MKEWPTTNEARERIGKPDVTFILMIERHGPRSPVGNRFTVWLNDREAGV